MPFYEINLLLSSKLSAEEASAEIAKLEAFLQNSGKVNSEKVEMKKLAYPILSQEEAWFSFITLYPEKTVVKKDLLSAVEKLIKENKNIIRHLTLKKEEIKIKKAYQRVAAAKAEGEARKIEIEEKAAEPQKKLELEDVEEKINEMLGE